ncbi:DUF2142 domain-containing protein [Methanobacterium paludis]|uniref:DUF2142 domain-containing protein n=1 Tax=Methanobacterium paludis (strain DSM 25820 / JCM 18151 / SWAN1) TaxID=868131 RepID=F6D2I7_METPW|nr:DUF2142 domain-containing protein [Methanobacterium paludis]AEG17344.1 Protein of unknown function DUF2142, membrane [Methanobacterium paludis]
MISRLRNIKPEKAFIIIGIIYGLAFLLVTPPFQGFDEATHFYRAADVSEAHFMPQKSFDKAGVNISSDIYFVEYKFTPSDVNKNKIGINDIVSNLYKPLNDKNRVFVDISIVSIVTYSPVPYLSPALGIAIGRSLGLSPLLLLYIGRFMDLLLWLVLVYFAIKITPVHKWLFLMVGLMPSVLFQGVSLSADSFTISIAFLVIALFLKFAFDDKKELITKKELIIIFTLILMLGLSKPFYFLLILLFFIIPAKKFGNNKKRFIIFISFFLSILAIIGFWYLQTRGLYMPADHSISTKNQLIFILTNPVTFIFIFLKTLFSNGTNYMTEFIGRLGWYVVLPNLLVSAYLVGLIFTALLDKNEIKINLNQKIIFFMVLFTISLSIFVIEYLTWTPVGKLSIDGVLGRYFIPIAPLFFLLFYNKKIGYDTKKGLNVFVVFFIVVSLSIALFEIIKKFYLL